MEYNFIFVEYVRVLHTLTIKMLSTAIINSTVDGINNKEDLHSHITEVPR